MNLNDIIEARALKIIGYSNNYKQLLRNCNFIDIFIKRARKIMFKKIAETIQHNQQNNQGHYPNRLGWVRRILGRNDPHIAIEPRICGCSRAVRHSWGNTWLLSLDVVLDSGYP